MTVIDAQERKWFTFSFESPCYNITIIVASLVLLFGFQMLMLFTTTLLYEAVDDFGAALAFSFLVGWPLVIISVPLLAYGVSRLFFGKRQVPVPGWFVIFAFLTIGVSVVVAVRCVPYVYLERNFATEVALSDTQTFRNKAGYRFSEPVRVDYGSIFIGSNVLQGQLCRSCGKDCVECAPTQVNVKYCLAPVVPLSGNATSHPTTVFATAMCFWFPCRSLVRWEGQGKVSEHDWDTACDGDPDMDACARECGPSMGEDGLTVLNGVELYGKKWVSSLPQGFAFRPEHIPETIKYRVPTSRIYNSLLDLVTKLEQKLGRTVVKDYTDNALMLNWGEEPIRYFHAGLFVTLVACAALTGAAILLYVVIAMCSKQFV